MGDEIVSPDARGHYHLDGAHLKACDRCRDEIRRALQDDVDVLIARVDAIAAEVAAAKKRAAKKPAAKKAAKGRARRG